MIRKIMEDVVIHHTDAAHHVATAGRAPSRKSIAAAEAREKILENDRIEHNPFFEKPRVVSELRDEERAPAKIWLWVVAILAALAAAFFIANYFSSATVSITPLTYQGHLERDFTAVKSDTAALVSNNALSFHFVSLVDEKSQDVPATIEQKIQKKAYGRIIIYNAYSSASQRLIKNTRLESTDHKIFRIDQSVVVPGAKMVAGKVAEPGTAEVVAYADVAGIEYNIGLGDFTIPGFKGDPRFTKFTARSKIGSPIDGGFSGLVKVPTDSEIQKAQEELKKNLKTIAVEKARALIPKGMSFFPGSTIVKFEEVPQNFTADDVSKVAVRATVSVFFFDSAQLAQKFAEVSVTPYQGNPVSLSNIASLAFTFIDPVENVVLTDLTQIRFHIVGDPAFIGTVDEQKIRTALLGKDKKDFAKIVTKEQNVGNAEATIRPLWNTTFPSDPAKIAILILLKDK